MFILSLAISYEIFSEANNMNLENNISNLFSKRVNNINEKRGKKTRKPLGSIKGKQNKQNT